MGRIPLPIILIRFVLWRMSLIFLWVWGYSGNEGCIPSQLSRVLLLPCFHVGMGQALGCPFLRGPLLMRTLESWHLLSSLSSGWVQASLEGRGSVRGRELCVPGVHTWACLYPAVR